MLSSSVAAIASATASGSEASSTRPMASTATSKSAWTKPMGWVHGLPVLSV